VNGVGVGSVTVLLRLAFLLRLATSAARQHDAGCEERHGDADERDHDVIDPLRLERIEHARREVAAEKSPACAKLSTPRITNPKKTENERIADRFGARQRASRSPP
jgi:hypothetical protein